MKSTAVVFNEMQTNWLLGTVKSLNCDGMRLHCENHSLKAIIILKLIVRLERFLTTLIYSDYVEINRLSVSTSNKHILSSTTFENILLVQLASSMHLKKSIYSTFDDDILNLVDLIEKELMKASD